MTLNPRVVVLGSIAVVGGMVIWSTWRDARDTAAARPMVTSPRQLALTTTEADLGETVRQMTARLTRHPEDETAMARLVEALIRLQRVDNDATALVEAEQRLRAFIRRVPASYEAQRLLGSVLLSQHRFRQAIGEAERARAVDPNDWWNYAVIGDASLELGDYDRAFEAYDTIGRIRPGPPAYARVAYALELGGDLEGALQYMRMAADGTSAHDAEGQAWHYAQVGNLLLTMGRNGDARREFERAAFAFPRHPYAVTGLARVKVAEGDLEGALGLYRQLLDRAPTPELAAAVGDILGRLGDPEGAERLYARAEQLERDGWATEEPQPHTLARFLAERNRRIPEAVQLAEKAATRRRDIQTMDALAWCYFKAGRLADAREAAKQSLRTGTRDPRIVTHAAAIFAAAGDDEGAERIKRRINAP
jgi:tetratricopeptide (TPR) repeat protein